MEMISSEIYSIRFHSLTHSSHKHSEYVAFFNGERRLKFFSSFHFIRLVTVDDGESWRTSLCIIIHRDQCNLKGDLCHHHHEPAIHTTSGSAQSEWSANITILHENSAKSLALTCKLHAGMSVNGEITSKAPAVLNHWIPEAPIDGETTIAWSFSWTFECGKQRQTTGNNRCIPSHQLKRWSRILAHQISSNNNSGMLSDKQSLI